MANKHEPLSVVILMSYIPDFSIACCNDVVSSKDYIYPKLDFKVSGVGKTCYKQLS